MIIETIQISFAILYIFYTIGNPADEFVVELYCGAFDDQPLERLL